ncbi:AimR family lysis-lysogeny pheromone receptor [Aquibacillus sp. 3ASR75-11]|uniref:AimR family lysis-lysogeny pheromone receptor n=1 Tax=Terrihalobacillus insolitus TaxID=2950438 RepID=A0A9X3WXG1_9BACI|nr:AimR family lysis-lysogeny pheromone receptor [Terrihalobacillus insolitus]MDC3414961.1 AimR family lysis-lysogeny pheromone receptor [Terrihalobacillus insolitus]MDC3425074.1 AimR family lysis-lysogeny pheromone receptor [Terrihalobacillus insolitus]
MFNNHHDMKSLDGQQPLMNKSIFQEQFVVNGEELPLNLIIKMLSARYAPAEVMELMRAVCLHVTSDDNLRVSLEFLYTNGFLDDVAILINKNKQVHNARNHNWASVYQVILDRRKNRTKPHRYLSMLSSLKLEEDVLLCLRDFLHVYAYYEMCQYGMLGKYLDSLTENLATIEEPLIKELFSLRLDEVLLTYHWKRNEMVMARKYGFRLLNNTYNPRKKTDIHNTMALGYVFDRYQQAMSHANEALTIAHSINHSPGVYGITNYTIPFISAYHGVTDGVTSDDEAEQAHLALARGDNAACIEIIANIEFKTPFQMYYLGKAMQDKRLLEKSYVRFIEERSDYFFARLPLLELNRLN